MRWPNGGPPRLWVVVENAEHRDRANKVDVHTFERREHRKEWLVKFYPTYSSHDVTLLEYVQKQK